MAYMAGINRSVDTADTYFDEISRLNISGRQIAIDAIRYRTTVARLPRSQRNVIAYINHGRWVADCPNCKNTEFVWEDNLFFCTQCRNNWQKGATLRVIIPLFRSRIEYLLSYRPIQNRNWLLTESVTDIEKENLKYLGWIEE